MYPSQFNNECFLFPEDDKSSQDLMENSVSKVCFNSLWRFPIGRIFGTIFGKFLLCVSKVTSNFSLHYSNILLYFSICLSNGSCKLISSYAMILPNPHVVECKTLISIFIQYTVQTCFLHN